MTKLTLDEIGVEIDKTLNKLERLQALYAAAQAQDTRRIEKLVRDYNFAQRKERDASVAQPEETPSSGGEGRPAQTGEAASVAGSP